MSKIPLCLTGNCNFKMHFEYAYWGGYNDIIHNSTSEYSIHTLESQTEKGRERDYAGNGWTQGFLFFLLYFFFIDRLYFVKLFLTP